MPVTESVLRRPQEPLPRILFEVRGVIDTAELSLGQRSDRFFTGTWLEWPK